MISQLARLHLCLIEKKNSAMNKRAHQALLHLIGVVVFARSEPDLAQRVNRGVESGHNRIDKLDELAKQVCLLR